MNWVDLLIISVIVLFAYEGQKRGFFIQIFDIFGFLIALILALTFYQDASRFLVQNINLPKIAANPIGFLLIWLITETIFFAVFDKLLRQMLSRYHETQANKILGFIPATANGILFTAFILLFVVSLPLKTEFKKNIFDSYLGAKLVNNASRLEKPFDNIFGPIAKQGLTFLTVKPGEKGSINLEFTQNKLSIDYQAEQRMLTFVNQERAKIGVKPLTWDEDLAQVGRKHSEDMFKRGYFAHYSPEGKDVGDRLENADISYGIAGENLALAPDVVRAHDGLMHSEGHRRNILDPAFKKIGIGAMDGGVYGQMFTQIFTD